MKKFVFAAVCLLGFAAAAQAGWFFGQFRTPTKIIVESDKFYIHLAEGVLNPLNCPVPGGGVVVRRAVVGDDFYKQLYAIFVTALTTQNQVELFISDTDCSFGPNVVAVALNSR